MIITIIIRCADQFVADSWAAFLELLWPFYTSENFSSISTWARCRIFAVQDFAFTLGCPRMSANHTWLICQLWMGTAHIPVQVTGRQILTGGTDDVKHLIQGWSSWQTQMMQCALSLQPSQGQPGSQWKWSLSVSVNVWNLQAISIWKSERQYLLSVQCETWKDLLRHKGDDQGFSLGHSVLISKEAGSNEQRRWATSCFYLKQCETLSPICPLWNMNRLAQTQRRWSGIQFRAGYINLKRGWLKWTKERSHFLDISLTPRQPQKPYPGEIHQITT